jgi:hypothetical protein
MAGGPSVSRPFTFTANGTCGSTIAANLQLQDGTQNLGSAVFYITLGLATPVVFLSAHFDNVIAPALPAGWTSSASGASPWSTSTSQYDTGPNAVYAPDPATVSDNRLISPSVQVTTPNALLTFRHHYNTEHNSTIGFDGGVLEISVNGGAFTDILSAGGSFVTNGYNQSISTYYSNPLSGRMAWCGDSSGFITSIVNMPPSVFGQNVRLSWRLGSDTSTSAGGWYVDTVNLFQPGYTCCSAGQQPLLVNPRMAGTESFAFSYSTVLGQSYVVEGTTNLWTAAWIPLHTNLGDGSLFSFTNSPLQFSSGFYRVRLQ